MTAFPLKAPVVAAPILFVPSPCIIRCPKLTTYLPSPGLNFGYEPISDGSGITNIHSCIYARNENISKRPQSALWLLVMTLDTAHSLSGGSLFLEALRDVTATGRRCRVCFPWYWEAHCTRMSTDPCGPRLGSKVLTLRGNQGHALIGPDR